MNTSKKRSVIEVSNLISFICFVFVLFGRFLVNNIHHLPLDRFFLENKSILVPDEIRVLCIKPILLHATLKEANDVAVIRVLCEAQTSAIMHELSEFFWLIFAKVIDSCLLLFLLNGCVFLGL